MGLFRKKPPEKKSVPDQQSKPQPPDSKQTFYIVDGQWQYNPDAVRKPNIYIKTEKEIYDSSDILKAFLRDEKMLWEPPIPKTLNGKPIRYEYHDVHLVSAGVRYNMHTMDIEQPLALVEKGEKIEVYLNGIFIGTLPENRLSGMVHDWNEKYHALYVAYIARYPGDGSDVMIHLVFYGDK
jgi:hypothetical protein